MRSAFAGKSRRSPALFVIVHARARVTGRKNVCIWPRSDWNQTPGPCIMQDLELIALGGAWLSSTRAGKQMARKNTEAQAPNKISVALVVNGTEKQFTVAPWTTLLDP